MKERTIKELLILLREYIVKQDYFFGMCIEIYEMYAYNFISSEELEILENYLKNNKPENINSAYWWGAGSKQPRLKWIDKQIKNL